MTHQKTSHPTQKTHELRTKSAKIFERRHKLRNPEISQIASVQRGFSIGGRFRRLQSQQILQPLDPQLRVSERAHTKCGVPIGRRLQTKALRK